MIPPIKVLLSGLLAGLFLSGTGFGASAVLKPGDDVKTFTANLSAGDVIQFSDGTYDISSTLDWDGVGTQSNPIQLKAVEGAHPVLRMLGSGTLAYLHDAAYVQVQGLTFSGGDDYTETSGHGLQLERTSNILISDCEVRKRNGHGIYVVYENQQVSIERTAVHDIVSGHALYFVADAARWTHDSVVFNNWIYNILGSNAGGIVLSSYNYGIEISDNVIHAVENRGIYLGQLTGGPENVVERNAIWSVGSAGIEAHGTALVRNNIIFNSNGYGIVSTPKDDDDALALYISHNSIENTLNRAVYYRHRLGTFFLANNALCNPLGYAFKTESVTEENAGALSLTHNIACGLIETVDTLRTGFQAGAGADDFEGAGDFDYWPSSTSHLVDAGSKDASQRLPTDDFNGLTRSDGAPDVGAYERLYTTNPGWVLAEGFKDTDTTLPDELVVENSGCGACTTSSSRRAAPSAGVTPTALFLLGIMVMARQRFARRLEPHARH